jgi:hypothetical protein
MNRLLVALFGAMLIPGVAAAQSDGRFQSGVVSWTPTLTLRDAGVDTNLYGEAENPHRDTVAVLSPQVSGVVKLAAADLRFEGLAEFVYYQRYTSERSVNRGASLRADFRGTRLRPFVRGSFLDTRERTNSEIDIRARRASRDAAAGLGVRVTPRGTLEVEGAVSQHTFSQDAVFRGVLLADHLNRRVSAGHLRFRYEVTPLTQFIVESTASRDRFMRTPAYDTDNYSVHTGFRFDPTAILSGRATVGFHRLEPVGSLAFGYEGITAAVELRYVLLQHTRFDVRVGRDTDYSVEAQPYFVQSMYGAEVRHNLAGPIDVIGRASRERLDYPGIPERFIPADAMRVHRYGGGVAYQPGPHLQLTVNYEVTNRDSDLLAERRYERRRAYTTLTYGF